MLKGERIPTTKPTVADHESKEEADLVHRLLEAEQKLHRELKLTNAEQKQVDMLYQKLRAPTGLIARSRAPFAQTGPKKEKVEWHLYFDVSYIGGMRCIDWFYLTKSLGIYIFHKFSDKPWFGFVQGLLRFLDLATPSIVTPQHLQELNRQCEKTMRMLYERWPKSEHTLNMHMSLHLEEQLREWGPSYDLWMFSTER